MEHGPITTTQDIYRVGRTTVQKIWETDLNGMTLSQLLPRINNNARSDHSEWFPAGTYDNEGHAFMSVHSWLVRHDGYVILIDAGIGNDKLRPQQKALDRLSNPFLARLRAAGVEPEAVDLVLVTHIHSDHVGWNTTLENDRWKPTFPNAQIIVSDLEYAYGLALTEGNASDIRAARDRAGMGEPVRVPVSGTFSDSILALAPGSVRRIAIDGSELLTGVRFLRTPGHSIDHASIEVESEGQTALFTGDVFHHPIEVYDPDLVSVFCEFPEASRAARLWLLDYAATTGSLVFSSHFPRSSAGYITRSVDGFAWKFS